MKTYIILAIVLLLTAYSPSTAQVTKKDYENKQTYDFLLVDEIPKFDYNGLKFSEYLNTNLKIPKFFSADDEVIASFVIDEKGNVCDIKVIKSYTEIGKNAVIEVLSSMPKWKAGRYKGEFVRVRLYTTIDFKIK